MTRLGLGLLGSIAVLSAAGCAAVETSQPCSGATQSQSCLDARRQWAEGQAPRPHQMTEAEAGDLSRARRDRELDYARERAAATPPR